MSGGTAAGHSSPRSRVVVEADGGSRGNPGPAGYGAVVLDAETGEVLAERAVAIGIATNNVAEYGGMIAGLQAAAEVGAAEVEVRMDSKLVVEQMSGRWQIKHPGLRPLAAQAADLVRRFRTVTFAWIPRAQNQRADALANQAMDAAGLAGARSARAGAGASEVPSSLVAPLLSPDDTGPGAGLAGARSARAGASEVPSSLVAPLLSPDDTGPGAGPAPAAPPVSGWEPRTGYPLRLLLIRHGETALTVERRYSGRGDVPLTERGLAQAAAVAARVGALGVPLTAVVTSPLERCVRTAECLAGTPIVVEPDLIECDFGEWEGLTFAEVRERWPDRLTAWLASTEVAPPGGESFVEVADRVRRAADRLRAGHPSGVLAVISHVSPLKLLLRDALAAGDAFLHRCHLDPAGLSIVDLWPDGGVSVRAVNDTAHLG